jgi:hypothetical protein
MALVTIPTPNASTDGNFYFIIDLDGSEYQLFLKYNERDDAWYMDISDTKGNAIRSGMRLVCNFPFMRTCMVPERPPGELMALDTLNPPEDPGLEDLDKRVVLVYEEQESLP